MLIILAAALVLSMEQSPTTDRALAEQLARSGQTEEALAAFERIAAANPTDIEVRLWIAALHLRMGRTAEAEAEFRLALVEQPSHVDARIGLAAALTRRDAWQEALTVLLGVEEEAGENADLFAALARAYRRAGDDPRALQYLERAMKLAPGNPELVDAYEATVRASRSSITVEGFAEGGVSDARSATVIGSFRVVPRLELEGRVRVQSRNGTSDTLGAGGGIFRINRSTNLAFRVGGGAGNISLADGEVMTEVRHYRGAVEIGGVFHGLSFADTGVIAISPLLAWDTGERWRLAARYTYSRSSYHGIDESSGDHSVLLRETLRAWPRVDMTVTYAYGIESFEDLTADRVDNLAAHTVAATAQFRLPSLTSVAVTWERQLRANDTKLDRLTVLMVQWFR